MNNRNATGVLHPMIRPLETVFATKDWGQSARVRLRPDGAKDVFREISISR